MGTVTAMGATMVTITATDDAGKVLAVTKVAAPVSDQMGCLSCHGGTWARDGSGVSDATVEDILEAHDRINRTDVTAEERIVVFGDVNRAIADNPGLGFGYGTFADSFRLYRSDAITGYLDRAHNSYLENIFELGWPAALALFEVIPARVHGHVEEAAR